MALITILNAGKPFMDVETMPGVTRIRISAYNENHDELGRFSEGDGGIPESSKDVIKNNEGGQFIGDTQEKMLSYDSTNYGNNARFQEPVKEYQTNSEGLNNYLRGKEQSNFPQFYNKQAAGIDDIINKAPALPEGLEMWRGLGEHSGETLAGKNIGDICEDKGFQSFSLNPQTADSFAQTWGDKGDVTMIRAITSGSEKGIYLSNRGEHEVIMPRGTAWKIVAKEDISAEGRGLYHVLTVMKS